MTVSCDIVLEQTLGHVTHSQNLQRLLPTVEGLEPTFLPVEYDVDGIAARIPGYGNWTIRAGLRARRLVRSTRRRRGGRPDAMFVHTQVPAVLLGRLMTTVPTVVSIDATPRQYDELGEFYAHEQGPAWLERRKFDANRRCFERAAHLVAWSAWAKQGLVDEYGVDGDRITVVPPGVDTGRWRRDGEPAPVDDDAVRLLFVGGDLDRKGGRHLLTAFESLRSRHGAAVELHLVTPTDVAVGDGVTLHQAMTPNSPELIELYHRCDVFCLPTLGDCLPMVLPEAGAAGLALVSTDVGAISEIVRDGETGFVVEPGAVDQLTEVLERLVADRVLVRRLGDAAAELVVAEHDAVANAARIAAILQSVVAP